MSIHRPLALHVLAHALGALTVCSIAVTLIAGIVQGEPLVDGLPFILLLTVTLTVGWLLAARLPRSTVGWILIAVPALFTSRDPLSLAQFALQDPLPGSQYNAERVVIAFGERIRNGADPHTAGVDLVSAVGQTLQPSTIGLWMRQDSR